MIYSDLILYSTSDKFYFCPVSEKIKVLVIDRITEEIKIESNPCIPNSSAKCRIFGLLGIIRLLASPYLIIVTERESVGQLHKQEIYKAVNTALIPYAPSMVHLNEAQIKYERQYIQMLESILATPCFYFSYSYDLSHSIQRLYHISPDFLKMPLHLRAEQKFIWNETLLKEVVKVDEYGLFCLPVIHGFVSINTCIVNGRTFTLALISRRSKLRAGSRLFIRGIDPDGNCANFVETEQIVETSTDRASFVQIRGSIPLYWQQWPNLHPKPKPQIIQDEHHLEAFNKHFQYLIHEYGRQVLVNLVDQKGSEGKLETFYRETVNIAGNPNIKYEAFDFHKECSKMRWDRLQILIDRLAQDQEDMGVMMMVGDGKIVSQQDGVFRTNCIDCLDRTNVVQSMLARRSLTFILLKLGVIPSGHSVESYEGLEYLFKNVWADNADYISIQYAGSGALKTDYTRTGKRTRPGIIQDIKNAVKRYYKNNFKHGKYQDSIDLFLGNYKIQSGEGILAVSPLEVEHDWKYTTFPLVLLVAVAMFLANLITPTEYTTGTLLCLLFWGAMISSTISTIFYYGHEFIDSPRLVQRQISPHVDTRP
ncbi:phosphatidylinositide phosphatase SAC1 [Cimex lectularius]|uniref:Phosphatidylinositol-3-phosphatase SAC1 n=1 Tax=Cimex lectularius TaxID=79782 RepID=A0A8I6THC3_CIMLE|nr:phosphatidylinositide phosphatase SAC1 [Cimex lectularius]XP_014260135.1 phosphatidylinositide phosphatase SAC1 [Cimex lectularius]